jgi:hypothetical protein
MTRRLVGLAFIAAVLFAGSSLVSPKTASAEIQVRSNTAANRFPDGIQFSVFLNGGGANITDVRLRYRILPDGVNASVKPTCTSGNSTCQVTVGNTAQVYMVPGAEIVYSWEATDDAGGKLTTPDQTIVYQDDRFQWDHITEGNLTVYFYFGDIDSQQTVLRTAQETVSKQSQLLRTTVDFPVKIWVYKSAQEMAPAIASRRGNGGNNSVQTLGEVGASDTALVSRDTDFLNIVRHELTHIVTRAATRNHIVEIPVWINEGLSIYAQTDLLPDEKSALGIAIQRNRALPITSLGASARGTSDVVSLFYAQSGSIIGFMINTYGGDTFADFIQALARDTTDGALNSVYGFDQLGLENAWRKAVGLPEVGASAGNTQQPTPTLAPSGSGQQQGATPQAGEQSQNRNPTPTTGQRPSQNANQSDDGGISLVTVAVILGAVVVLLVLAAAGLMIQQKRREGA